MYTQEEDRSKRFSYLLEQTEIFGHFMSAAGSKSPKSPLKIKPSLFSPKRDRQRHPSEGDSRSVFTHLCYAASMFVSTLVHVVAIALVKQTTMMNCWMKIWRSQ